MSTYRPSRPRRRLLSILLFATLLLSLAMPALAARLSSPKSQEGAPPAATAVAEQSAAQIAATDKIEKTDASPEMARSDASPNGRSIEAISGTTYPFTSASGAALEDMSTGTTQLVPANVDDTASSVTNIGFDFWFDGVRYTQFSVNANGLMRLGATVVGTTWTNDLATTTNVPQIAPYWDDLYVGTNGQVHFKVIGSAPNRKLVVEWQNMQIPRVGSGTTGAGTFQAWLYESTGVIEFVYGSGISGALILCGDGTRPIAGIRLVLAHLPQPLPVSRPLVLRLHMALPTIRRPMPLPAARSTPLRPWSLLRQPACRLLR